ncbi:MAG: hypothetical protein E7166_04805 [Firmicutes bacterium]|nr:hypothetical protein [Bacillota bacterium]
MNKENRPSIEKPWLKYYEGDFSEKDIPKKSIYQLAIDSNKYNMNNIAIDLRMCINNYEQCFTMTYNDFFKEINNNAKSSSVMGIKTDEIVPMIVPNIPEARTLTYANSIIGATTYAISPLLPVKQLEKILKENQIKNIFVFSALYDKYKSALQSDSLENVVVLSAESSKSESIEALKKIKNELVNKQIIPWNEYQNYSKEIKENLKPYYKDNHTAIIVGTSGTTGTSKGVCLSDKNLNSAALSYINGKVFEGSYLDALLPSIVYGTVMSHLQVVDGKHVYLVPELLTTNISKALCATKADVFAGGPVHYININASEEFKNGQMPKRNIYLSGGASLPSDIESKLNGVGAGYSEDEVNNDIIVRQGYALSETCGLGTIAKRGAYTFGSVGIPMLYNTIGIFKPGTDEELGYNENGEICVSGPSVMQGYLNNPEETAKVLMEHSDGKIWVHTKDIGYMNEDGKVFHVDRIKNIFMRTGFNVHPTQIAEFIDTIPYVKNSAVIGFEHPEEQNVPVAFIELEPNVLNNKTQEEIIHEISEQCYANLEETSIPVDYVIVDSIPINVGGKIDVEKIKKESNIDFMKNQKILKKEIKFNK